MVWGYCSDISVVTSTKDTMQLGCFFLKELACPNSILISVQPLTYDWGSFKADLSRSSNSGHEYIELDLAALCNADRTLFLGDGKSENNQLPCRRNGLDVLINLGTCIYLF